AREPTSGSLAPPLPRLGSGPASKTSSARLRDRSPSLSGCDPPVPGLSCSDPRPAAQTSADVQTLIVELERIQARIGIAHATCRTAQRALEGLGLPHGIDIGRALGFGAGEVLAAEFSRLEALVLCLKERRPLD